MNQPPVRVEPSHPTSDEDNGNCAKCRQVKTRGMKKMWGVTCCRRCSKEYRRFLDAKFMQVEVLWNAEKKTLSVFTRVGNHSPPEESTRDQV